MGGQKIAQEITDFIAKLKTDYAGQSWDLDKVIAAVDDFAEQNPQHAHEIAEHCMQAINELTDIPEIAKAFYWYALSARMHAYRVQKADYNFRVPHNKDTFQYIRGTLTKTQLVFFNYKRFVTALSDPKLYLTKNDRVVIFADVTNVEVLLHFFCGSEIFRPVLQARVRRLIETQRVDIDAYLKKWAKWSGDETKKKIKKALGEFHLALAKEDEAAMLDFLKKNPKQSVKLLPKALANSGRGKLHFDFYVRVYNQLVAGEQKKLSAVIAVFDKYIGKVELEIQRDFKPPEEEATTAYQVFQQIQMATSRQVAADLVSQHLHHEPDVFKKMLSEWLQGLSARPDVKMLLALMMQPGLEEVLIPELAKAKDVSVVQLLNYYGFVSTAQKLLLAIAKQDPAKLKDFELLPFWLENMAVPVKLLLDSAVLTANELLLALYYVLLEEKLNLSEEEQKLKLSEKLKLLNKILTIDYPTVKSQWEEIKGQMTSLPSFSQQVERGVARAASIRTFFDDVQRGNDVCAWMRANKSFLKETLLMKNSQRKTAFYYLLKNYSSEKLGAIFSEFPDAIYACVKKLGGKEKVRRLLKGFDPGDKKYQLVWLLSLEQEPFVIHGGFASHDHFYNYPVRMQLLVHLLSSKPRLCSVAYLEKVLGPRFYIDLLWVRALGGIHQSASNIFKPFELRNQKLLLAVNGYLLDVKIDLDSPGDFVFFATVKDNLWKALSLGDISQEFDAIFQDDGRCNAPLFFEFFKAIATGDEDLMQSLIDDNDVKKINDLHNKAIKCSVQSSSKGHPCEEILQKTLALLHNKLRTGNSGQVSADVFKRESKQHFWSSEKPKSAVALNLTNGDVGKSTLLVKKRH